jgi:hypothetical protein
VPAEQQRRAVVAIQTVGGNVGVTYSERAERSYLQRFLPRAYLGNVEGLLLWDSNDPDPVLNQLRFLKHPVLDPQDAQVTDAGLDNLRSLAKLRQVDLWAHRLRPWERHGISRHCRTAIDSNGAADLARVLRTTRFRRAVALYSRGGGKTPEADSRDLSFCKHLLEDMHVEAFAEF